MAQSKTGIEHKTVKLARDCAATEIPSGTAMLLPLGFEVTIMQTLGGFVTVITHQGQMARIADAELDALGDDVAQVVRDTAAMAQSATTAEAGPVTRDTIMDALTQVYDPEIPVNIVDLGLVYVCDLQENPDGGTDVVIKMTMTAPGCGMGDVIARDTEHVVSRVAGVKRVHAEVVWDPPWSREMMSEAAKLQLGMY
jgi:probable FeS assembly SUF system protein SufT